MNLRECFERVDTETWARSLGLNMLLFSFDERHKTTELAEYSWAKRVFEVISGDITFESIFDESLNAENVIRAAAALELIGEPQKPLLTEKLRSLLFSMYKDITKQTETLENRIKNLKQRNIPEEVLSLLEEAEQHFTKSKPVSIPKDITHMSVSAYFRNYIQKFRGMQEEIEYLETYVTSYEKQVLKDSFEQLVLFIETIRPLITDPEIPQKKLIDRYFLMSPQLVLSGRKDLLSIATEALKTGKIYTLEKFDFPTTSTGMLIDVRGLDIAKRKKQHGQQKSQQLPLRVMTNYYLRDAGSLEGEFESEQAIRELVLHQLVNCKTDREAASLMLKASNTIASIGHDALDLQGKGLTLMAEVLLLMRKYTHAFELFVDGFCILNVSDRDTGDNSFEKRTAITGALLADWTPRLVGQKKNLDLGDIVRSVISNPYSMLEALRSSDEMDVVFHVFDELREYDTLHAFIEYLENMCPTVEWRLVLMERNLQPRIFLKDIRMRILQAQALVGDEPKGSAIRPILEKLELIIDTDIPGRKISNEVLTQLDKDIIQLEQQIRSGKNKKSLSKIYAEGMRKIYDSLRDKVPRPTEILFAFRPVSSTFYPEEQNENMELIVNISVQDASLPISSLQVTCRIDEDPRLEIAKLIIIHQTNLNIGYMEPGSIKELSVFIDVDRSILTKYSSVPFRFDFFDGIKAIEPSDNKHIFQIAFRTSRPSSRINPYIAGKAVERGGLYIGREREIDSIKKILMGQTQDNIPLILGIRRIGKTSLLKRLADDDEITRKYVPVFFDLQDMPESETTADFLKRICEKVHKECGDKWNVPFNRSNFATDPSEAFLAYLSSFVSAKGNKRVLIIFDECEKLIANMEKWQTRFRQLNAPPGPNEGLLPEIFGTMRKAILHAKRVSFIFCGLPFIMNSFREYESRWFGLMEPTVIKTFDIEEARKLIQPTTPQLPYKVSQEAMTHILYMSGRQPYLIQLICRKLFDYAITSGKETMAKKDVEEIIERDILPYESYFSDYKSLIGDDRPILKAITAAHERQGRRRQFVPTDDIFDQLRLNAYQITRNQLVTKLQGMELSERPLVERSPINKESYRIVIGLLSILIQEGLHE